jgi:hypothetical protein
MSIALNDLIKLVDDNLKPPEAVAKSYSAVKPMIEEDFAVIASENKIYQIAYDKLISPSTWKEIAGAPYLYLDEDGNSKSGAEAWLKDAGRQTYDEVGFYPGKPRITNNNVNTWIDPEIVPVEGDVSDYIEGLLRDHVFKDEPENLKYFLQWSAHPHANIHNPKMFVNALLWSDTKGEGKDLSFFPLAALYGKHSRLVTSDDLTGTYTGHLANSLFIHASEIDSKDKRAAQKLKFMAVMPTIRYEEKYRPKVEHQNYANIGMTANYVDAVFMDSGERRYFVHHAHEERFDPKKGRDIYHRYVNTDEGKSALLWYLLNKVDRTGFEPNAPAPQTDALRAAEEASLTDLQRYAIRIIEGTGDAKKFASSDIWRLEELAESSPEKDRGVLHRLGNALINRGAVNFGQVKVNGHPERLWAIRNGDYWRKKKGAPVADAYKNRNKPKLPKFDNDYAPQPKSDDEKQAA